MKQDTAIKLPEEEEKETLRVDRIKSHFEEEAQEFDGIIVKLIPNYLKMVEALTSIINIPEESKFSMVDLGCGTGTISKAVKDRFPDVNITCVDIAGNMLEIAKNKLGGDVTSIQADFNSFEFPDKYDVVVSSLALHHLESDSDKLGFYKKIFSALNNNGIFINIDVVLGSDDSIQVFYMKKWKEFMSESVSEDEINNKWLVNYYAEDRPAKMISHLDMLRSCGFSSVDVVYKHFNFAVYSGRR
jgi:tRNA (cmo5U34)-methyltransferase